MEPSRPGPTASTTPTTTLPTASPTSMGRGDTGPAVLQWQQDLSRLGYWLGRPDGRFGQLTEQPTYALQKAAGINRDGRVVPRPAAQRAA